MRWLCCLISFLLLLPLTAYADVTLTDGQGYAWDVNSPGYGSITNGTSDAYDYWPRLCVMTSQTSTAACSSAEMYYSTGSATYELSNRQLVLPAMTISGLSVQRKIYVPSSGTGYARFLEILTNPTGAAIAVKVRVGTVSGDYSDVGSDSSTTVTGTSDGTGVLKAGLTWFTTDDSDATGDPSLAHVLAGSGAEIGVGALLQDVHGQGTDAFYWEYRDITVPAGTSRIVVHFESQQANRSSSQSVAAALAAFDDAAQAGLTSQELAAVVNFPVALRAEANGPYSSAEGASFPVSAAGSRTVGTATITSYDWDCSGDGIYETRSTSSSATCQIFQYGTYTTRLRITDSTGATASDTALTTITNVAPQITRIDVDNPGFEGSEVELAVTVVDPGTADTLTYTWTLGDGTTATGQTVTHAYTDEGSYDVSVTVRDGAGASASLGTRVSVANANPVIQSLTVPASSNEGQSVSLTASASDPGADDVLTYTWDFGDGAGTSGVDLTSPTHTWSQDGNYTVSLTVTDDDGGSTTSSRPLSVQNLAPSIGSLNCPGGGEEGSSVAFSASAADAGDDPISYAWTFGDGGTGGGSPITHTYLDDGSYTVALTASDDAGASSIRSCTVPIENVAPSIDSLTGDFSGAEGELLLFSGEASDPGADLLTYTWTFGDGSPPASGLDLDAVGHTFTSDGAYTLTLTVIDDDGGSASTSRTVNIGNGAPYISSLDGDATGDEGESLRFEAVAADPGADALTYLWDFGDGSPLLEGASLSDVTHTYADDGAYVLILTVTDAGGLSSSAELDVQILNVAPVIDTLQIPPSGNQGEVLSFRVFASDPGEDVLTYRWDLGDGSTATGDQVSHTYLTTGLITVRVSIDDGDEGGASASASLQILNVAPELGGIVGPVSLLEGETGTWTAPARDAGGAPVLYAWSFGDGSSATGDVASHAYARAGTYLLGLTVTDNDGASSQAALEVVVEGTPPAIDVFQVDAQGDEGAPIQLAYSSSDPSGGAVSALVSWGDGSTEQGGASATLPHTYADDGDYLVSLTVSDEDGMTSTQTSVVTIRNVAPSILAFEGTPFGNEGETFSFAAQAADAAGQNDPLTYRYDFGDGSEPTEALELLATSHVYTQAGQFAVVLVVSDGDGGSASRTLTVNVATAAPYIVKLDGSSSGDEGSLLHFQVAAGDPTGQSLTYTWDFGDGTVLSEVSAAEVNHAWLEDGLYLLTVDVMDPDGNSARSVVEVAIANVAPEFLSSPPLAASDGELYRYVPEAIDAAGLNDPLSFQLLEAPEGMTLDPFGALDWTPTLAQAEQGSFSVVLEVSDDEGARSEQAWVIVVEVVDTDGDGMPDSWEEHYDLDPADPADADDDPDGDGRPNLEEYEDGTDPSVPDSPQAPRLVYPAIGAEVATSTPTLVVENVSGFTEDGAFYQFEVYADAALAQPLALGSTPAGAGASSWVVTLPLPDNADAFWRARGGNLEGFTAWSEIGRFFVNTRNEPPTIPVPSLPLDGASVGSSQPNLEVSNSSDVDRDVLVYHFVLALAGDLTAPVAEAADVAEGPSGSTRWQVDTPLSRGQTYQWRARAIDEEGLASDWSDWQEFSLSDTNLGPSVPVIVSPADGSELPSGWVTVDAQAASDPEGDALTYLFQLDADETFSSGALQESSSLSSDDTGHVVWVLEAALEENVRYYARVLADDGEVTSDWSPAVSFSINEVNEAPGIPTLQNPSNGALLEEGPLTLSLINTSDPDGDSLTYTFVVATAGGEEVWRQDGVIEAASGITSVLIDTDTLGGAGAYSFTAFASDEAGLAGDAAVPNTFFVAAAATPTPDEPGETSSPEDPDDGDVGGGCTCRSSRTPSSGGGLALVLLTLGILGGRRAVRRRSLPASERGG